MPNPNPLIEVHEDRISRLEETVTECRVGLGVLDTKVSNGFEMLAKKIDEATSMENRVAAIEKNHEIEREVKARTHERRVKFFKIAAAFGSASGVAIGLLMKMFWGE